MPVVPISSLPDFSTDPAPKADVPSPRARHRVRPRAPVAPPADTDEPSPPADYVVGYGRPPVHTRFKPGKSGNPKGRPKGARGLNTLARELLTAKVPVRTPGGEKKMHRIEAVLHKTFELALKGNPRALSQIFNLYASAVPEQIIAETPSPAEDLTATDLAILEGLKATLLHETRQ